MKVIVMRGFQVPSGTRAVRANVPAAPSREHLDMKTFFRVALWILALFLGLFVWNVTPDFRPIISWILAAAFVCYVLSIIVEVTIKRLIADELLELRRQSNATVNRLDLLDRKVTAILRDALEQRRFR